MEASQAWGTATYVYDSQNQLIRENNQRANKTLTWTYNAAGNILNRKEYAYTTGTLGTPTDTVNYTYGDTDWGDLLTGYDGTTITYDEIGNPLTGRNGSMTWEHGRQLASMGDWQFAYDANGMRRTRTDTESGDIYRYFYTGGQLKSMRAETVEAYVDYTFYYDASGNPLAASYFVDYWGVGEYSGLFEGMFYYVTNAQGDVTALVSETGELLVTYDYDAWGKPVRTDYYEVFMDYRVVDPSQFVSHNPFRYRGYVYDTETGLYYLQSRYYDPEVGRFINADNIVAGTAESTMGYNLFVYCFNNPVNMDDSGGNWPKAFKDTVKWVAENIVRPAVKSTQKGLSTIDATFTSGISISGASTALLGSSQVGISADTEGNIALQKTKGGGIKTGSSGFAMTTYCSITNAPDIYYLEGLGYQLGASSGKLVYGVPVTGGVDFNIIPDNRNNTAYVGLSGNAGLGTPGDEFHVAGGYTKTDDAFNFNIFKVFDEVYIKIMEW